MAQKVVVELVDDIDGGEAHGTVEFGLDGHPYLIDLSEENEQALRDALAPFIGNARRPDRGSVTRPSGNGTRPRAKQSAERARYVQLVRDWARSVGENVPDRGRISQRLIDRYESSRG